LLWHASSRAPQDRTMGVDCAHQCYGLWSCTQLLPGVQTPSAIALPMNSRCRAAQGCRKLFAWKVAMKPTALATLWLLCVMAVFSCSALAKNVADRTEFGRSEEHTSELQSRQY